MDNAQVVDNLDTLFEGGEKGQECLLFFSYSHNTHRHFPVTGGELAQKRQHDAQRRHSDETKISQLLERAQTLRAQLYQVRWDQSTSREHKKRTLLALKRELLACERAAQAARREADETLDRMLALDGVGIGPAELFGEAGNAAVGNKSPLEEETEAVARAKQQAEQSDLTNLKMLRVQSKEVTREMNPADKWAHLYGMYDSSRQPQAQLAPSASPSIFRVKSNQGAVAAALSDEEITKLRGQIYHLRQRTNMTQPDKVLLSELQAKLRAATGGN